PGPQPAQHDSKDIPRRQPCLFRDRDSGQGSERSSRSSSRLETSGAASRSSSRSRRETRSSTERSTSRVSASCIRASASVTATARRGGRTVAFLAALSFPTLPVGGFLLAVRFRVSTGLVVGAPGDGGGGGVCAAPVGPKSSSALGNSIRLGTRLHLLRQPAVRLRPGRARIVLEQAQPAGAGLGETDRAAHHRLEDP